MAGWRKKSSGPKKKRTKREDRQPKAKWLRRRKKSEYPEPPRPVCAAPARVRGDSSIVTVPAKRPPAKKEEPSPEKVLEILDRKKRK